jgi:hypothetical protein
MLLLCLPSYHVHLGLLCFADIPPLVHPHSWWFHTYVLQERSPMPYPYQMERPSANVVHPCPNLRICHIASTLKANSRTLNASTSRHFARTEYKGHLHSPHTLCTHHSRQLFINFGPAPLSPITITPADSDDEGEREIDVAMKPFKQHRHENTPCLPSYLD